MEVASEYEHTFIQGVSVIVWKYNSGGNKTLKRKRKQLKEKVGAEFPDKPMLDQQSKKGRLEFCDIVFTTENVNDWREAVKTFYKKHTITEHRMEGGIQYAVTTKDNLQCKYAFYDNTKCVMIQPGDHSERKLMKTLKQFPEINSLRQQKREPTDKPCSSEQEAKESPSIWGSSGETNAQCEGLVVNLPPITRQALRAMKDKENSSMQQVVGSEKIHAATQTSKTMYVDELLCYIRNRIDVLPTEHVIRHCLAFYNDEEIVLAQQKIFTDTKQHLPRSIRYIKHKGEKKSYNNVNDIIKLFHSMELCDIPMYVASDLTRLPPLTALDTDIIALHRKVEKLVDDMSMIKECSKGIEEVTMLLKSQNTKSTVINTTTMANTFSQVQSCDQLDTHSDKVEDSSITADSNPGGIPEVIEPDSEEDSEEDSIDEDGYITLDEISICESERDEIDNARLDKANETIDGPVSIDHDNDDTESDENDTDSDDEESESEENDGSDSVTREITDTKEIEHVFKDAGNGNNTKQSVRQADGATVGVGYMKNSNSDHASKSRDEWQKVPAKKRRMSPKPQHQKATRSSLTPDPRNEVIRGKGRYDQKIKPASKHRDREEYANRSITGTFISRLSPKASAADIAVFVHRETGLTVRPERLQTKYQSYSSFFIRGNNRQRRTLMSEHLWPRGIIVKAFYE